MARKVVVLGFEGYQELHIWYPVLRLREEGDDVLLAGPDDTEAVFGALGYPLAPQAGVSSIDPTTVELAIVAGGPGAAEASRSDPLVKFLGRVGECGGTVVAVGEGAELLAAAALPVPAQVSSVTTQGCIVVARDADALPELFRTLTN